MLGPTATWHFRGRIILFVKTCRSWSVCGEVSGRSRVGFSKLWTVLLLACLLSFFALIMTSGYTIQKLQNRNIDSTTMNSGNSSFQKCYFILTATNWNGVQSF